MTEPSSLDYFAAERPPTTREHGFSWAQIFWALTPGFLAFVSFCIWLYRLGEPFYGGSPMHVFVYWLLTPLTLLAWLAWTGWTIGRVIHGCLRARWVGLIAVVPVGCYQVLTSLNVYLSDQGMRSELIAEIEGFVRSAF